MIRHPKPSWSLLTRFPLIQKQLNFFSRLPGLQSAASVSIKLPGFGRMWHLITLVQKWLPGRFIWQESPAID